MVLTSHNAFASYADGSNGDSRTQFGEERLQKRFDSFERSRRSFRERYFEMPCPVDQATFEVGASNIQADGVNVFGKILHGFGFLAHETFSH